MAVLDPDLLFGSKVEGGLRAAGHEVSLHAAADASAAREADLLVASLGSGGFDPDELAPLPPPHKLGYHRHTDPETRRRAEAGGFDLVVPRSRMAREMAELAERVLAR